MSKKRKIFLVVLGLALLSVLAYATVSTTTFWKIVRENTLFVNDVGITGPLFIDGVIYADGGVSGAVNGTIGAGTPAAGAFTTVTASTSIKVDANGSTVSQINCGTTTIDAGTTGTTVSLTGCTASTRVFVCPVGDTGSATSFKATPGSGSFIVKSNADPSSVGVVVNWFAIK